MIKPCRVTQVDYQNARVKVMRPDVGKESNWLVLGDSAYDLPQSGQMVMASFDDDDYTTGVCHGSYYHGNNPPPESGATLFYQRMAGDIVVKYDSTTKELEITAQTIKITGDVEITGDVRVTGDLQVSGTVTATSVQEGG